MAGVVHIPWYATGFRGDKLENALLDVSKTTLRYGATAWQVHRNRDDRYRMLQMVEFGSKADFERWWHGPEMIDFRVITSGWWQIPVLYVWHDLCGSGVVGSGDADQVVAPSAAA